MNHLIKDTKATVLDGTTATFMETRGWLYFSFQFTATADVAEGEGAQFEIQCAPPSEEDPCVPGDFEAIPEVVLCDQNTPPAETSILALEGPIAAGQTCYATAPCACNGFVTVVAPPETPDENFPTGAEASFDIVGLVKGPR